MRFLDILSFVLQNNFTRLQLSVHSRDTSCACPWGGVGMLMTMITVGVLTISDGAAQGTRQDASGETIRALVAQLPQAVVSAQTIIPDEQAEIGTVLREWSDQLRLNLVLTTG